MKSCRQVFARELFTRISPTSIRRGAPMASGQRRGVRRRDENDFQMERACRKIGWSGTFFFSLTAIPRPMHQISSELRSEVAHGLVSTCVGDRLGRPQGAVSICCFLRIHVSVFFFFCSSRFVKCTRVATQQKKACVAASANVPCAKMATVTLRAWRGLVSQ